MGMYGGLPRTRVPDTGPGLAKQSAKDECDVNLILDRFRRTGAVDHLARGTPVFADVSEVGDYRTALENARAAEKYFAGLPAKVRAEFGNDAVRYLEALQDPEAGERLRGIVREVLGDRRARSARERASDREVREEPPAE